MNSKPDLSGRLIGQRFYIKGRRSRRCSEFWSSKPKQNEITEQQKSTPPNPEVYLHRLLGLTAQRLISNPSVYGVPPHKGKHQ